jgi:hypothetical protein
LGTDLLNRARVELHHLETSSSEARHDRPVVVAGGLNADTNDDCRAFTLCQDDSRDKFGYSCLSQIELERRRHDFPEVISDQAHHHRLSDIYRTTTRQRPESIPRIRCVN